MTEHHSLSYTLQIQQGLNHDGIFCKKIDSLPIFYRTAWELFPESYGNHFSLSVNQISYYHTRPSWYWENSYQSKHASPPDKGKYLEIGYLSLNLISYYHTWPPRYWENSYQSGHCSPPDKGKYLENDSQKIKLGPPGNDSHEILESFPSILWECHDHDWSPNLQATHALAENLLSS